MATAPAVLAASVRSSSQRSSRDMRLSFRSTAKSQFVARNGQHVKQNNAVRYASWRRKDRASDSLVVVPWRRDAITHDSGLETMKSNNHNQRLVLSPLHRTPVVFRIGRDRRGNWVVQGHDGRCGGLFVGRDAAIRFALSQNGRRFDHVVMVDGVIELDLARPSQNGGGNLARRITVARPSNRHSIADHVRR